MMLPAVVRQAARRRTQLRGDDLRVLVEVCEHLDLVVPRRLKLVVIAGALAMSEASVSRALGRLVDEGCLGRSNDAEGRPMYRLFASMQVRGPHGEPACQPDLALMQVVTAPARRARRGRRTASAVRCPGPLPSPAPDPDAAL